MADIGQIVYLLPKEKITIKKYNSLNYRNLKFKVKPEHIQSLNLHFQA